MLQENMENLRGTETGNSCDGSSGHSTKGYDRCRSGLYFHLQRPICTFYFIRTLQVSHNFSLISAAFACPFLLYFIPNRLCSHVQHFITVQ